MITSFFGILLVISVLVILYMAQKNYENIDIYYWTLVILIPVVVLGYWLKTRVTTVEGAKLCFCFIYIDSTVLLTAVIFNIMRFMGIAVKSWIKLVAYIVGFGHLFIIWLCFDNDLYYKNVTLIDTGLGTATKMVNGPLKIVHWIYLILVLGIIIALMIMAIVRKGTYSRRTLTLYSLLTGVGILVYIIESILDVDFSNLPALYVTADILIALNYDHAHTHDIACLISEQQKYHGTKGYVAFDLDRNFLSCNSKIYDFVPELKKQIVDENLPPDSELRSIFYSLIDDYRRDFKNVKKFDHDGRICQCEISEFSIRKDGKVQGYLFDIDDVTEEEKFLQVMKDYNTTLNKEVDIKTESIKNIQEKVVLGLANMVENRDNNTGGHVKRTSDLIKIVVNEAKRQGVYSISEQYAEDIVRAAPMHDIGKITIENSILCKPGDLTKEEFNIMKTHSVKSGEFVNLILKGVEEKHFVDVAYNVARYHHERWDGRGYPEGLVGEMIPLEARLMAIADVYDALVSQRYYKKPLKYEEAAKIMIEGMGSQFDPNMLSVFLGCRHELEEYYKDIQEDLDAHDEKLLIS
ncbi:MULTISPECIES: HD domain-containing phosphohydrolase [Butyrivibrio]|jgi:HD-GYP domain-containing protein (c-di-GMP phosphodiesterase class II)|uniref:HD domain-containing phosphohydrolase n=1 Tax=Butyrivibrio TaxID=830 RepID=UPI00040AEF5C|nr:MULTISPECIES: HD domain-containing phosphohydrolase [Butyrivibrio]SEQ05550.1 N-terminal 7TM region of histidine kinase [Butyrivibrio sp. TB]